MTRRAVRLAAVVGIAVISIASWADGAGAVIPQDGTCAQEGSIKSLRGDTPTPLRFVNNSRETVQTFWLDYSGLRVFYNRVAPGTSYVQSTWVTHPWVVADQSGRCLVLFVTDGATGTVTVTDAGVSSATPTTIPPNKKASATRVSCNRDATETSFASLTCNALVSDASGAGSVKPSGTVRWTAKVGAFPSGDSCNLTSSPTGVSACTVQYRAKSDQVPIGSAPPVKAAYQGDVVFAPSSGTTQLGGGTGNGPVTIGDDDSGGSTGIIAGAAVAAVIAAVLGGLAVTGKLAAVGGVLHLGGSSTSSAGGAASGSGPPRTPASVPNPPAGGVDPAALQQFQEGMAEALRVQVNGMQSFMASATPETLAGKWESTRAVEYANRVEMLTERAQATAQIVEQQMHAFLENAGNSGAGGGLDPAALQQFQEGMAEALRVQVNGMQSFMASATPETLAGKWESARAVEYANRVQMLTERTQATAQIVEQQMHAFLENAGNSGAGGGLDPASLQQLQDGMAEVMRDHLSEVQSILENADLGNSGKGGPLDPQDREALRQLIEGFGGAGGAP